MCSFLKVTVLLAARSASRLDFIELRLHRHAVAQSLKHDTTMFGRRLKHLHVFPGEPRLPFQANLTLDLLESDWDIAIDEQGAANINFRPRADFKTHDRNFEPIRNNPQS